MRSTALLTVLFLSILSGCQSGPHPAPGTALLQVKVVAEPKAGVAGSRVSAYDQSSEIGYGAFEHVDYSNLRDIVIWLEPADQVATPAVPAAPSVTIDLSPHGTPAGMAGVICQGQKLVVRNPGDVPLNVYSVSDGNEFNLGTIPPGGQAAAVVNSPGLIELISDTLADPVARVYVVPTSWSSLTKSGATVDFNDLPPGKYHIYSWHPRLPGSMTDVDLAPDRVEHASITVGVNPLPKIDSK